MSKKGIRIITIIVGLLLAVAVVCSHVLILKPAKKSEQAKTEQKPSDAPEEFTFTSAPTVIPSASAHVQSNLVAHFISEIIQPQEKKAIVYEPCLQPQRLLLTLFRVIISPNAP